MRDKSCKLDDPKRTIFSLYNSFADISTASDTLIAAKYLKQLFAMDEEFEKVDKEKICLEKANLEFQGTVGEAATTQMKTYASKQRSLTIEPVDGHLVGINIVSSSDPPTPDSDLSKTLHLSLV